MKNVIRTLTTTNKNNNNKIRNKIKIRFVFIAIKAKETTIFWHFFEQNVKKIEPNARIRVFNFQFSIKYKVIILKAEICRPGLKKENKRQKIN